MACDVYMGAEDVERQRLNVFRMEMMGATVHAVETGTRTLKDAVDAAFGAWMMTLKPSMFWDLLWDLIRIQPLSMSSKR